MVDVKSNKTFYSKAVPYNSGWLVTTNLPDFGEIHAFAETESEIELMARQNITSFTDLPSDSFDVQF